jgi:hypothetical protein
MGQPFDHYISRAHMRQWATTNNQRVTVLRRSRNIPKLLDIGNAIAAERGLNDPAIEKAYGKVESTFTEALPRLLESSSTITHRDWQAAREYAVLTHDRYPALPGSASDKRGLPGGNAMVVPNPANWGGVRGVPDPLANLATMMDREQLKEARLQMLPVFARMLPKINQVFHVGPMLLGDAGIHALVFHPDAETARSFVAMPLSSNAMIVFGDQLAEEEEVFQLEHNLRMKVAIHSNVVVELASLRPLMSGATLRTCLPPNRWRVSSAGLLLALRSRRVGRDIRGR